jgi:hypothetical protein
MRFHASAVIQRSEPSQVLRMLETMLRDVTIEIVSAGQRMTLAGFGPGAVSMNQNDSMVLTLEKHSDGVFIEADGTFDGSYLAEPTNQEANVRSKLERVFAAVQELIDREETGPRVACDAAVNQLATGAMPVQVAMAMAPAPPVPADASSDNEPLLVHAALRDDARTNRISDVAPARTWRIGVFAAAVVGIAMMSVVIDRMGLRIHRRGADNSVAQGPQHVPQPVQPKLLVTAPTTVTRPDTFSAGSRFSDTSPDAITWLRHWERAMLTRNAVEESSFYADRVDLYEGQERLSNAEVKQMKRKEMAGRKGLWAVKLEGIVIKKRTKDAMEIQLIKHVMDRPALAHTSEQYVQTELRLKRVNGDWKIVSEENLEESPNPIPNDPSNELEGPGGQR